MAPGAGFETMTASSRPGTAGIVPVAVRDVDDTKVGVKATPPTVTVEPETKPVPAMLRVGFNPMVRGAGGLTEVITGAGLSKVTVMLAVALGSTAAVALMVTAAAGRTAGAL